MGEMTAGEALVEMLVRQGIDTLFGLPGAQMYPLFDALQRRGNDIRTIGCRHEQGAAYMAFGYAKSTGRRDGSQAWIDRAKGWMRVMYVDAWASMSCILMLCSGNPVG